MAPQSNTPHDDVIVPATDGTNSWNAHTPVSSVSFIAPAVISSPAASQHSKQPEPTPPGLMTKKDLSVPRTPAQKAKDRKRARDKLGYVPGATR